MNKILLNCLEQPRPGLIAEKMLFKITSEQLLYFEQLVGKKQKQKTKKTHTDTEAKTF